MNRIQRSGAGRLTALAGALVLLLGGCGGGSGSSEQIVQAQEAESNAWAKAKAEGKDKRKAPRSPETASAATGRRGYVNKPGG